MTEELILVHVVFRHGERTPDRVWIYPNESHLIDQEFPPFGSGQLTNEGKRTMYKLGSALRERYKSFLQESYTPGIIEARSTDVDRTKISLQLVLASLFKPVDGLIWSNDLNWLPVPFTASPRNEDKILAPFLNREFNMKFSHNLNDGSLNESIREKFQMIIPALEGHTGLKFRSTRQLWGLAEHLKAEETCGLEMLEWCKSEDAKKLKDVGVLHYAVVMSAKEDQKLLIGDLLMKLMDDTKKTIEGSSKVQMHIYSGHEINLANLLIFLSMWEPHFPPYGSCLALEVYKIDRQYVVKVAYRRGKDNSFQYIPFGNDKVACNVEEFEEMIKKLNSDDVTNNNHIN